MRLAARRASSSSSTAHRRRRLSRPSTAAARSRAGRSGCRAIHPRVLHGAHHPALRIAWGEPRTCQRARAGSVCRRGAPLRLAHALDRHAVDRFAWVAEVEPRPVRMATQRGHGCVGIADAVLRARCRRLRCLRSGVCDTGVGSSSTVGGVERSGKLPAGVQYPSTAATDRSSSTTDLSLRRSGSASGQGISGCCSP